MYYYIYNILRPSNHYSIQKLTEMSISGNLTLYRPTFNGYSISTTLFNLLKDHRILFTFRMELTDSILTHNIKFGLSNLKNSADRQKMLWKRRVLSPYPPGPIIVSHLGSLVPVLLDHHVGFTKLKNNKCGSGTSGTQALGF